MFNFISALIKYNMMSADDNDRKDNNNSFDIDDLPNVKKIWIVEWNSKFEKTSNEERTNYQEAVEIFNEKAKEKKDTILYEIQKSISDDKILKKIPILNSSRYTERKKKLIDEKEKVVKKDEVKKPGLKIRFIILLIIMVVLIITIYWINIIVIGGTLLNPHIVFHIIMNDMGITINNIFTV
jgi:hypothetical protein